MFGSRYFIVQDGSPPLVTVVLEGEGGRKLLEVVRNQPADDNAVTTAKTNPTGIVTVSDDSGFLYKIRPESETSVTSGRVPGGDLEARIGDTATKIVRHQPDGMTVDIMTISRSEFTGLGGIRVDPDGSMGIGFPIPAWVTVLFS